MVITVVGSGYVGLVTGVCLAELGHEVSCVDTNHQKISKIKEGVLPIYEPELDNMFNRNIEKGLFNTSIELTNCISESDVIIIAVGTPIKDGDIDLSYIQKVSEDIGLAIRETKKYHVICVKSTVVPGTTENIVKPIIEKFSGKNIGDGFGLAMNPEFLAEGSAVKDFMNPDRIVIGSLNQKSIDILIEMYSAFKDTDILVTNASTAEMIKYTSNSFLATLISFSNEISNLCMKLDNVDVMNVMNGVHLDRRLMPTYAGKKITPGFLSFLKPGTGFGGSCFSKDLHAITSFGKKNMCEMMILNSVLKTNKNQPAVTVGLARKSLGTLESKRITILGLSFKPGTDDIRESPAIPIIKLLIKEKAFVVAHDPKAISNMKNRYPDFKVKYELDLIKAIDGSDAIILVTAWDEYIILNELLAKSKLIVIDGRRYLDPNLIPNYYGIGFTSSKD